MQALGSEDPRQVGEYRLLRRLGAGGMGRVYLGRTAGGRTVAVKLVRGELAEDAEFRARFRQEVAAARRVGGAWTAPVLDADTEGEHPWVATGYVAGPALGEAVRAVGRLPELAVRSLGVGLAEALAHVHALGLVHRDVKPSNVLLTLDGPRLIDFGIARALDATSGVTQSGYVVGSPGFMSPEQAEGRPAGPPSDVFSLGAVLAYAATGVPPFGEGVSVAVLLYRVLHEEPDLAGLGPALRPVVAACLAKDPADRPTPRGLLQWLDADGAAAGRLARGGWLPPGLAEEVGRGAVRLLDLEGETGPDTAGAPPAAPLTVPPEDARPVDRTPTLVPAAEPGRTAEPGGRRWIAGLVGGLVLAAVAAVLGHQVYRGLEQPDATATAETTSSSSSSVDISVTASTSTTTSSTTTTVTQPPPGTAAGPSVVPAAFVGTWSGDMTTEKGLPAGTTTLTIGPAALGQANTTSRNAATGLIPVSCEGSWTLRSASPEKLVFVSRLVRSSLPGACTGGSNAETLTLQKDGTIRFTSDDPAAGNPSGTLRKAG
ncbi:serine/threonine-protein kinase [Kitasatospora sp. NPDC087315]|uniref:serine/threonine-protein kinase n=1 Tax=Kitasatospora sp. NPDC087315 TaxID=3364069 RepID=UPI0037F92ECF